MKVFQLLLPSLDLTLNQNFGVDSIHRHDRKLIDSFEFYY